MRVLVICFNFLMLVVAQEFYDRRYDYFDVDALIHNRRLLSRYLLCFLDKGPCPPIGKIFKNLLPEVVMTKCAKCSPRQKIFAKKVITAFDKYLPEDYEKLKKKLDPENKHFQAFEESLASM